MQESTRKIKAVVFDVFGTLCYIGDKRRPYGKLLNGTMQEAELRRLAMSRPLGLCACAALVSPSIGMQALAALEHDLHEELLSIRLYPETVAVLQALRSAGYRIALASNLAQPYAVPVKHLLPFELDAYAWSFDRGCIKPDPRIYQWVVQRLGTAPGETLMIGDTFAADYEGASNAGLQALHLDRRSLSSDGARTIHDLTGVLTHLNVD